MGICFCVIDFVSLQAFIDITFMFTIHIYLKLALIALTLIGGFILSVTISFWYALPIILIGLVLLASYLLLGTVQSTADLVQKQQFDAAERRLNFTLKPNWLYSTNKAYYYIMKGTMAMQRNDVKKGEEYLHKAEKVGLNSDNERGMIKMSLVSIYMNKGKQQKAKSIYRELKKLNITEPNMKGQLKMLDTAMKNVSANDVRLGGMQQKGMRARYKKLN